MNRTEPHPEVERAREAALRMLDRSRRTRRELERKLIASDHSHEAVAAALDRLEHVGLIDDVEYVRAFVRSRLARRPLSMRVLTGQLRARGVGAEAIERALSGPDAPAAADAAGERVRAERALAPLLRRYRNLDPREARAKMAAALARRGFDYDTVSEILDATGSRDR